jgi:hypothetical protein
LLFDALFDLAMITLILGFYATLFDPGHDIVAVGVVAVGPFANSIGPFLLPLRYPEILQRYIFVLKSLKPFEKDYQIVWFVVGSTLIVITYIA